MKRKNKKKKNDELTERRCRFLKPFSHSVLKPTLKMDKGSDLPTSQKRTHGYFTSFCVSFVRIVAFCFVCFFCQNFFGVHQYHLSIEFWNDMASSIPTMLVCGICGATMIVITKMKRKKTENDKHTEKRSRFMELFSQSILVQILKMEWVTTPATSQKRRHGPFISFCIYFVIIVAFCFVGSFCKDFFCVNQYHLSIDFWNDMTESIPIMLVIGMCGAAMTVIFTD